MNNKKVKKIMNISTAMLSTGLIAPLVVSCSDLGKDKDNSNTTGEQDSDILFFQIQLTDSGKQFTASEFLDKCKIVGIEATFREFTNWLEIDGIIRSTGKIDSISFDSSTIKLGKTENSISVNINFVFKGNKKEVNNYEVIGFTSQTEKINKAVQNFNKNVSLVAKSSAKVTSQYVWNLWYNTSPLNRTAILYEYIDGIPEEILTKGTFDGVSVSVANSFIDETSAKKIVNWNSDAESNSVKGEILTVNFQFSINLESQQNPVKRTVQVEIAGFDSFQKKIDGYANTYVNTKGNMEVSVFSITPTIISNEYNSIPESDSSQKYSVLSKYISNVPLEGYENNEGVSYSINSISPAENGTSLTFISSVFWNGLEKEVSFDLGPFMSDQQYMADLELKLNRLELTPSRQGAKKSSMDVFNEWEEDNSTIFSNIQGIPSSFYGVEYSVTGVSWDSDAIPETRGSTLFLTIKITYNGIEKNANNVRCSGFTTPYSKYQVEFSNKANSIVLTATSAAINNVIDVVTDQNYSTYIIGIPESDDEYEVSSLSFDYSLGTQGKIIVSFLYSWKTPIDVTIYQNIICEVGSFKTYGSLSAENFADVIVQMAKSNYPDLIKKTGESYSYWLTSYFGYDLNSSTYIEGFSRLWNIPSNLFGLKFEITNVQYSKTNSSLSDTQLRFTFKITDIYRETTNTFSNTWTVSGFYNPYTSTVRNLLSSSDENLNSYNISNYDSVPAGLQFGDANVQTTAISYWFIEPYAHYKNKKTTEWIDWATSKAKSYLTNQYANDGISSVSVSWVWRGDTRYGKESTNGTCPAPVLVSITFSTNLTDRRENSSKGKYNSKTVSNKVLWLYFRNRYWGG